MRRRILLCLPALLLLLLSSSAWAITCAATAPAVFTCDYDEPKASADGSQLDDLAFTNMYFQIGAASPVKQANIPASSLAGGGHVTTSVTVPVAANQKVNVKFWATATDTSGNESGSSNVVTKTVDRLPPMPPA